jgi:hypothetical protein
MTTLTKKEAERFIKNMHKKENSPISKTEKKLIKGVKEMEKQTEKEIEDNRYLYWMFKDYVKDISQCDCIISCPECRKKLMIMNLSLKCKHCGSKYHGTKQHEFKELGEKE